jgi:hypothetical protein
MYCAAVKRRLDLPILILLVGTAVSCRRPLSSGAIIDGYKAATCVPVSNRKMQDPHTREWDTTIRLTNGSEVMIVGYQMPGGRIMLRYPSTGRELEAANAGDYVYPSDVRFNSQANVLFIKASGLAGGLSHETWLFEYDVPRQQLVERRLVADSSLPAECPESP